MRMLLVLFAFLAVTPARAADAMPIKYQVALFKKVFSFNRTLASKPKVHVVVLDEGERSREMVEEFGKQKISAELVKLDALPTALNVAPVLYFEQASPKLAEQTSSKKVLSVSGNPALAENGNVSLSVRQSAEGRPEILINLPRAKAEGQDFASDLLGLATVIR